MDRFSSNDANKVKTHLFIPHINYMVHRKVSLNWDSPRQQQQCRRRRQMNHCHCWHRAPEEAAAGPFDHWNCSRSPPSASEETKAATSDPLEKPYGASNPSIWASSGNTKCKIIRRHDHHHQQHKTWQFHLFRVILHPTCQNQWESPSRTKITIIINIRDIKEEIIRSSTADVTITLGPTDIFDFVLAGSLGTKFAVFI